MANIVHGVKYYLGFHKVQLFFNMFICEMFYFLEDFDIPNYADVSTPYNADKHFEFVVNNLEHSSSIFLNGLTATT